METNEMSSENTEQELSQEALDAANAAGTPPVVEPTVPLHVHTALRTRAQDAEIAKAHLEGKLEALQNQNVQTAVVSPLQTAKEAYIAENGDLDGFAMSVELYEQDTAFKDNQVTQAAEIANQQALGVLQSASIQKSRLLHDDFNEVIAEGQKLMTDNEYRYVSGSSGDYGELAYEMSQKAIARSKPAPVVVPTPENKPGEPEPEPENKPVPKQDEILVGAKSGNPRIGHLMDL